MKPETKKFIGILCLYACVMAVAAWSGFLHGRAYESRWWKKALMPPVLEFTYTNGVEHVQVKPDRIATLTQRTNRSEIKVLTSDIVVSDSIANWPKIKTLHEDGTVTTTEWRPLPKHLGGGLYVEGDELEIGLRSDGVVVWREKQKETQ